MRKFVEVPINLILSVIHCSDDCGYDSELLRDLAEMLEYKLSKEEIEAYAEEFKGDSAYCEEDYNNAVETLMEFKNQYCHE